MKAILILSLVVLAAAREVTILGHEISISSQTAEDSGATSDIVPSESETAKLESALHHMFPVPSNLGETSEYSWQGEESSGEGSGISQDSLIHDTDGQISVEDSALKSFGSSNSGTCWLSSYGRGVGTPITTCGEGRQKNGALCYPECDAGYNGVGPVCWSECPSGFTDTGADCLKPKPYGRGAGYITNHKCESGHSQGCQKNGLLYYPICDDGFHAVGCCICSPDCPDGMTDIGVSCQKHAYGRGAGVPLSCGEGLQEDAALCYTPCKDGYDGVGPVCWGTCPEGLSKCGALCLDPSEECSGKVMEISMSVIKAAVDVANVEDDPVSAVEGVTDVVKDLYYPICN